MSAGKVRHRCMTEIPLTQGRVALVDDLDSDRVSQFKWFAVRDRTGWYAKRKLGRKLLPLSNFILGVPIGVRVDHQDRNGLNAQRQNLRVCSHGENCRNRRKPTSNKSGFKGVSWKRRNAKWCAQIKSNGKVKHLGLFTDVRQAAQAYDTAAELAFGEFALTNEKLGIL